MTHFNQFEIVLSGGGGELDRELVEVPEGFNETMYLSNALRQKLSSGDWLLAVGDTISIHEVY